MNDIGSVPGDRKTVGRLNTGGKSRVINRVLTPNTKRTLAVLLLTFGRADDGNTWPDRSPREDNCDGLGDKPRTCMESIIF